MSKQRADRGRADEKSTGTKKVTGRHRVPRRISKAGYGEDSIFIAVETVILVAVEPVPKSCCTTSQ